MSKQLLHMVFSRNAATKKYEYMFRRPQAATERYDANLVFAERESSAFLKRYMPCDFLIGTWDLQGYVELAGFEQPVFGIDHAKQVITEGLNSDTVPGFPKELGRWVYFNGTIRDNLKVVFIPERFQGLNLEAIGIKTSFSDESHPNKFNKYMNRLQAPVEHAVFGEVVDKKDDGVLSILTEDNKTLDIRTRECGKRDDGISLFSPRGAQLLAGLEDPRIGDGFRFTCAAGPLYKGHAVVMDIDYDAVLIGPKKLLTFDSFYFGRLSELHVSIPNSDIQSIINFLMLGNGPGLLYREYENYFRSQVLAIQDREKWLAQFYRLFELQKDQNQDNNWVQLEAARLGLTGCLPFLFRGESRMIEPQLEATLTGVVPLGNVAQRRYLCPSPWQFDRKGNVCPELDRLKGQVACSSGLAYGPAWMFRQPNGNVSERYPMQLVQVPQKHMGKGELIFLGTDMIEASMARMGGGDFDDPVIVITDPEWVNHFNNLPEYPKVATSGKSSPGPAASKKNSKYFSAIQNRPVLDKWSKKYLFFLTDQVVSQTGIGVIVNALMLDTCLTTGQDSMLADLADQIASIKDDPEKETLRRQLVEDYIWLEKRPAFLLREVGADLEKWIDALKLNGGDLSSINKQIRALYEDPDAGDGSNPLGYPATRVYPFTWTIGGFMGHGRIPDRIAVQNPTIARTQLCQLLEGLTKDIQAVKDAWIELEWLLVPDVFPAELLAKYNVTKEARAFVTDLGNWWREACEAARTQGWFSDRDARRKAFTTIYAQLEEKLAGSAYANPEAREVIAVEYARRRYKTKYPTAPINEQGETYHVRDGMLSTPSLGIPFLKALEKAGLTGIYEPVELDAHCRRLDGRQRVVVQSGVVTLQEDGGVIGQANKVPDGKYDMHHGRIEVRPVHASLIPTAKFE